MKKRGGEFGLGRYVLLFLIQLISVFILSLFSFLIRPLNLVYPISIYALVPLFSSFSAYKLTRKGINPYLSFLLPPVAETLAGFTAAMGIGPEPLPVFITAFISLVGAAAGDVRNKMTKKG